MSRFVILIVALHGVLEVPAPAAREPYVALLESIVFQQLAGAAARAIWGRVLGLFDGGVIDARRLIEMTDEQLRSAGLSRGKALSMRAICTHVIEGKIPSAAQIGGMSDQEIYAQLTKIRGIGAWTVDMLMLFTLKRPDVMPITDYGIRKGYQVLYKKRQLPTPKQLLVLTEKWRPHRSVAALYLWRIAETAKRIKKKRKTPKKRQKQRQSPPKKVL